MGLERERAKRGVGGSGIRRASPASCPARGVRRMADGNDEDEWEASCSLFLRCLSLTDDMAFLPRPRFRVMPARGGGSADASSSAGSATATELACLSMRVTSATNWLSETWTESRRVDETGLVCSTSTSAGQTICPTAAGAVQGKASSSTGRELVVQYGRKCRTDPARAKGLMLRERGGEEREAQGRGEQARGRKRRAGRWITKLCACLCACRRRTEIDKGGKEGRRWRKGYVSPVYLVGLEHLVEHITDPATFVDGGLGGRARTMGKGGGRAGFSQCGAARGDDGSTNPHRESQRCPDTASVMLAGSDPHCLELVSPSWSSSSGSTFSSSTLEMRPVPSGSYVSARIGREARHD